MAAKYPEIAAAEGPAIKAKYGGKYPQLGPLVDVLSNKQKEAASILAAGDRFFAAQQEMESRYAADHQAVDALPDEVQVPMPSFAPGGGVGGMMIPFPNPDKVTRKAALDQVQPALFPLLAAQTLSPAERHRARLAGAITQAEFDPFGDDMPVDQRSALAAALGWLTGDAATAARTGVELESSRADKDKRAFDTA
jgi:hypothetical protein